VDFGGDLSALMEHAILHYINLGSSDSDSQGSCVFSVQTAISLAALAQIAVPKLMDKRREEHSGSTGSASKGKGKQRPADSRKRQKPASVYTDLSSLRQLQNAITGVGELSLEPARNSRLVTGGLVRTFLLQPDDIFEAPLQVIAQALTPAWMHQRFGFP
jgi:hypothetical protein